jgi:HK97 family phage major capsid protein
MTTQVLEKLCEDRDQARDAAIQMASADGFSPEDPTFVDLQTRATELDKRVASLTGLIEQRQAADALDGKFSKAHQHRQQGQGQVQTRESWGETFTRSQEFMDYRFKGNSGVLTIDDVQTRALPTGVSDLVAAGLTGTKTAIDASPPAAPTPLLDNVTTVPVSGNSYEVLVWGIKSGGAAVVAEKAAKPPVEFAPTVVPGTLDNIAGYTQLTRAMMEDFQSVTSLIDSSLRRDVAREEEEHAAAALVAATLPTATGDSLLEAIRVGIGEVQSRGYNPGAVVLNPSDYAAMDVAVMGATLLGPAIRQTFWGLTVVPANSQPAGTATVGDLRSGVQHLTRSAINLFVSDSHGDTFLSNVFTLLAERRSKTVVVRPQALVECSAA